LNNFFNLNKNKKGFENLLFSLAFMSIIINKLTSSYEISREIGTDCSSFSSLDILYSGFLNSEQIKLAGIN
jgi:hypothetical protein